MAFYPVNSQSSSDTDLPPCHDDKPIVSLGLHLPLSQYNYSLTSVVTWYLSCPIVMTNSQTNEHTIT